MELVIIISFLVFIVLVAIWFWLRIDMDSWKSDLKNGKNIGNIKLRLIGRAWLVKNSFVLDILELQSYHKLTRAWLFKKVLDYDLTKDFVSSNYSLVNYVSVFSDYVGYSPHVLKSDVQRELSLNPNLANHVIFSNRLYGDLLNWKVGNVYKLCFPEYLTKYCELPDFSWEKAASISKITVSYIKNSETLANGIKPYFKELMGNPNISDYLKSEISQLSMFSNKMVKPKVPSNVVESLPDGFVKITDELFRVGSDIWVTCEGGYYKDIL